MKLALSSFENNCDRDFRIGLKLRGALWSYEGDLLEGDIAGDN